MTEHTSNPMSNARPDASATSDTHPTPPALTAAQMADEIERLKALATQAVEAREAYRADQDSEELSRRSWLGLDRLHRACDPTTITGLITALTTATARLSEVTNEWESCLERDRAHRDEVREYQARLTEVERERDTARKDAEEWRTTELERTIAQARQDLANLDADLSAERWGREEDIKCAARALTTAQARIEALEGLNRTWGERMLQSIDASWPGMTRAMTDPSLTLQDYISDLRAELTAARTRAEGLEGAMAEARAALHTEGWMRHVPAIVCAVGCIDRALTPPPAPTGEEPTR